MTAVQYPMFSMPIPPGVPLLWGQPLEPEEPDGGGNGGNGGNGNGARRHVEGRRRQEAKR